MVVFRLKFHSKKSAKAFLCVNTVSNKVVWHSLAYLSVQELLVFDVPFYLKFWPKLAHPFKNADCQSIFARSASAVTPREKIQLTQIGSQQDAQLSQRDRAAGCVTVFAKSRRLELGDNILRTL